MEVVHRSASSPGVQFAGQTLPHFSPAGAILALRPEMLNLDECRGWILRQIHQEGPQCLHCGATDISADSFFKGKRICCRVCGVWFTASTGTILAGSTLDYRAMYLLAVLIGMGQRDTEIAGRLGLNRKTVAEWRGKLRGL
jgi:transposase-like protein